MFGVREGEWCLESLRTEQEPSERGWCLLIVPILIAPHFHPTSSCLWWQLGVLSWWWSSGPPCHPPLIVVIVVIVVILPSHCHHPALVVVLLSLLQLFLIISSSSLHIPILLRSMLRIPLPPSIYRSRLSSTHI